jgi:hypothetical protein
MNEGWFYRLCAALDTPGGHILTGMVLIILGGVFLKVQIPEGKDLILFASGALMRSMLGQNGKGAGIQPPTGK